MVPSAGALAEPALLAVLAVALVQPVPAVLARSRWPQRAPRAALALWAAIGLAAGLSTVGALLALAVAPLGGPVLPALADVLRAGVAGENPLPGWAWGALGASGVVLAWQLLVLARCLLSVAAARRAHRTLLDLVGTWDGDLGSVVLEDARMVAYHLPGLRDHRVVLTRGCVDLIERRELDAVLAHERAHARGHHHVLLEPFIAWQRTFPFVPAGTSATAAVALLTELLADDAAVAAAGRQATLEALIRVGCVTDTSWTPSAATLVRARRLATERARLPGFAAGAVHATALTLLVAPTLILLLA